MEDTRFQSYAVKGKSQAMKTLIVEDEFTCRMLLQEQLEAYGPVHTAVNGLEALEAVRRALDAGEPYDLVCMDIMMPELDGQAAVARIRELEKEKGFVYPDGARIVMTTALDDVKTVSKSFGNLCDAYLVKPIHRDDLIAELQKLNLVV